MTEARLRQHLDDEAKASWTRLADGNNEGRLTPAEREELQGLVREAEEIALSNARRLASSGSGRAPRGEK